MVDRESFKSDLVPGGKFFIYFEASYRTTGVKSKLCCRTTDPEIKISCRTTANGKILVPGHCWVAMNV